MGKSKSLLSLQSAQGFLQPCARWRLRRMPQLHKLPKKFADLCLKPGVVIAVVGPSCETNSAHALLLRRMRQGLLSMLQKTQKHSSQPGFSGRRHRHAKWLEQRFEEKSS